MRRVDGFIRIIAAFIDYIIVSLPVYIVMIEILKIPYSQGEVLLKLLLAVYGTLFMEYMNGATLGKSLGACRVRGREGNKPTLVELGMRELLKSFYFIPVIGWGLGIISAVQLFIGEGLTLHDRIAGTRVVYAWVKEPEGERYEKLDGLHQGRGLDNSRESL